MFQRILVAVVVAAGGFTTSAEAQKWHNVKIKFLYDGTAPTPKPENVNKDVQFCGKSGLVDETLLVDPKTKGIANVVGYLYLKSGQKHPPIHPSYEKAAKAEIKINNAKCRYEPRMVLLRPKQTLVISNPDPVGHNTKMDPINQDLNPGENFNLPAGSKIKHKFNAPEVFPAFPVACNIHPWMKAWVVLKDTPYMGASNKQGELVLKNVPEGQVTIRMWHEKGAYIRRMSGTAGGKAVKTDRRGRMKLDVKKDLEVVFKLPPKLFKGP